MRKEQRSKKRKIRPSLVVSEQFAPIINAIFSMRCECLCAAAWTSRSRSEIPTMAWHPRVRWTVFGWLVWAHHHHDDHHHNLDSPNPEPSTKPDRGLTDCPACPPIPPGSVLRSRPSPRPVSMGRWSFPRLSRPSLPPPRNEPKKKKRCQMQMNERTTHPPMPGCPWRGWRACHISAEPVAGGPDRRSFGDFLLC